jgi:spore coat protein U-like protein
VTRSLILAAQALAAIVCAAVAQPCAAGCTLGSQSVVFGNYNPLNGSAIESVGYVNVNCDNGTPYTIRLSAGGGSFSPRRMANGAHTLDYNLYTDTARTTVWGDGIAAGTVSVSSSGTGATVDHPVYGRIPGSQTSAYIGGYTDTITVTLTF